MATSRTIPTGTPVTQTITDGDTTHAPSGDAVFDALAGKDASGSAAAAQSYAIQRSNHTGTQAASTISDFAATVRSTVLTGLSTATNAAIAATDTVLQAMGKAQAQISALASTVSGLITQTITNGDTTHAPSGDAVFDALEGKFDKTGGSITGAIDVAGSFTGGDTAGGTTFNFFRPGTSPAGSAVAYSSPAGNPGIIGINGGVSRSDIQFGVAVVRIGASATTSGPTRFLQVTPDSFGPNVDNAISAALPGARYSVVYAGTGAINTSDAREKTAPRHPSPDELAAALDIARLPCVFQWLAAIEEKGEAARLHASPTVQAVIAAMEAHGLDPFRYGFVCYDEWDEQPEVKDEETGEVTQEYRPAGNRYSLRPSELAHFIQSAIVQRQDGIEARLAALEGR